MSRPRLIAWLLALVTLVVYLPAARHDFLTYDDDDYVTNNPMVQNGLTWADVKWAFTTFHAGNWHPFTWLSHMADCQLFLLNPAAHHLVNVLFHCANTALLFLLLWQLTKKFWPSAFVAALFGWHPLHVESVAWIAERKDVLSTFFALLTLWFYTRHVQTKTGGEKTPTRPTLSTARYFWLALIFFALGLLAKPMLVTLPFVMLLLDYWPLNRISNFKFQIAKLFFEKWPFFLLTAISCGVTFVAQSASHAVISLAVLPLPYRIENAAVAVASYLLKIFWPAHLAVIYPFALPSFATFIFALTALVFITALAWQARQRNRCWLTGWLWFLGTLVPVSGLVQVGGSIMADRYTYLPSIGIFIAIAFGLPNWLESKKSFQFGIALLLIACGLLTEKQLTYWRDSETLFRHTLAITTNNLIAHVNLGAALDQKGRPAEALAEYREVIRLDPAYDQIHFFIGNLLEKMGRPDEALIEYRQCLAADPNLPDRHAAAGNALAALGNVAEATKEFAEAERLNPHYAQPHLGAAKIFLGEGQITNAVAEIWIAVRLEPYNFEVLSAAAHFLAANENPAARDGHNALMLALKADELSLGSQPSVADILGMAYAETGDFSDAVNSVQTAIELAQARKIQNLEPFQQRLKLYQNRQPWRESFSPTNIINPRF